MKMKEFGPKWGARPCRPQLTIESQKKIVGEILWKYFETNCRYCQRFLMQTKIMKSTQNVIQESTKKYNLSHWH